MGDERSASRKWGRRILVTFNVLAALSLLASYLATHVAPSSFWPLSFFGLGYPVILLVNGLFFVWWLFRKQRKLLLISALSILVGCGHFSDFFQLSTKGDHDDSGKESFKLLSYNVRLFDLYNWQNNTKTRNQIFDLLEKADADILCFQEFYHTDRRGYFETKDTLVQFLKAKNIHADFTYYPKGQQHFGAVTLSRFPIVNKGVIDIDRKVDNHVIFCDIKINEDTLRVYNAHLASLSFRKDDYDLISEVNNVYVDSTTYSRGRKILSKLKHAFLMRERQINTIMEHIDASPHPVVLSGDFNDTPVSWAYRQCNSRMTDAFIESGNGIGATYVGAIPSLRIDYIFHSDQLRSYQFEVHPEELSDHRAIECWMQFMPAE